MSARDVVPWWLFAKITPAWSREEIQAIGRIYRIACPAWVLIAVIELPWLATLRDEPVLRALAMILTVGIGGVFLARLVCGLLWPSLMQRADRNARARRRGSARSIV